MLGKVQALFGVRDPCPKLISQLLEFALKNSNAPDFPPHFLTRRRKILGVIRPERFQSRLTNRLNCLDEVLAWGSACFRKFSCLIFAQNCFKDLASLIGNVQPNDAMIVCVKTGRTGLDPVSLSFNNFDPRTALQFQFKKRAFGWSDS